MAGFKLEGTSAGEIAPHAKTEPGKNGLAGVLLINPTVTQRNSNLLLSSSWPQKGKEKKKRTVRQCFLTTSSSAFKKLLLLFCLW